MTHNPSRSIVAKLLPCLGAGILALLGTLLLSGPALASQGPGRPSRQSSPADSGGETQQAGSPTESAGEDPSGEAPAEAVKETPPAPAEAPAETVQAQPAEAPAVEVPQVEVPPVEVPQVEVPQVEVPQVEVPQVEVPPVAAPVETVAEGPPAETVHEDVPAEPSERPAATDPAHEGAADEHSAEAPAAPQDPALVSGDSPGALEAEAPTALIGSLIAGPVDGEPGEGASVSVAGALVGAGPASPDAATGPQGLLDCELSELAGSLSDSCTASLGAQQSLLAASPAALATAAAVGGAPAGGGDGGVGGGGRSVVPPPGPAPGGAFGGSSAGGSGIALAGSPKRGALLRLAGPRAMRRLRLSCRPWLTAFFVLIPERPG